jgi:hypothetical protein
MNRVPSVTRFGLSLCVAICLCSVLLARQRTTETYVGPGGSPHVISEWILHGAQVSVSYGRPYLKGRRVGETVVPYKKLYRTGADDLTVLTTSKRLRFDKLIVPPGQYTLFTIPDERRWTLVLQKQTGPKGLPPKTALELGRVPMTVKHLATTVEQFTIDMRPAANRGATLVIAFGHVEASARLTVVE